MFNIRPLNGNALKWKNFILRMSSPKTSTSKSSDIGPCIASGETSGSQISTSRSNPKEIPCTHKSRSLSAIENQYLSLAKRNATGSLIILPFWSQTGA